MTTPNQLLRQAHIDAQDAVDAYWDILVFMDTRLTRPYVIQVRQKREAQIIQSYCFDTIPAAILFLEALVSSAKGSKAPDGHGAMVLVACPPDYVFKEVEPPKRTRKPAKTDSTTESVEEKPKRKRRTQAEIAADLKASMKVA